jgi:extracellular factor (EF) 3-hydroxypalmitic acid methyl ester biosynthesis protein
MSPQEMQGIVGRLSGPSGEIEADVVDVRPYALRVHLRAGAVAGDARYERLVLESGDQRIELGPALLKAHPAHPMRRRGDPPSPRGDATVLLLGDVCNFSLLRRQGTVIPFAEHAKRLPLVWGHRRAVKPAFRELIGEIGYDLRVYRGFFDDIDRDLRAEPPDVRELIQLAVLERQFGEFCAFFDQRLADLERVVAGFSRQEHEIHGFYLRAELQDIIMASEMIARSNIKPRGYAGDSEMMQMIYENAFRGATIFEKAMHRHPVQAPGAQAVRNRRALIAEMLASRRAGATSTDRLRVMSVACGPAWELRDLFRTPEDCDALELVLLDQDGEALAEAKAGINALETQLGRPIRAHYVKESVRRMLAATELVSTIGQVHFLYSMGLFDYLTQPVAQAVLGKLYTLLLPGGELVIGNYHPANSSRVYMDYWCDWPLIYRTEETMAALAAGLPHADARVFLEPEGCQGFLQVKRLAG